MAAEIKVTIFITMWTLNNDDVVVNADFSELVLEQGIQVWPLSQ